MRQPESGFDLFLRLIAQAEAACDDDPVMHEAAAMVYVGDVYALRATHDLAEAAPVTATPPVTDTSAEQTGAGLRDWPFIR